MDISDVWFYTLIVLCCYQKCPLPLDKWENWEARLTDDWGRGGWWIVGEIAAAEEEEISDMRKRKRARAREKEILQPLHCSLQTFTGSAIWKTKEGVCVLSDSERVLDTEKYLCWNVRDALWLATLSSQGHWRRRGLAPFLVKLFYQGCVGCISTSSPSLHRASRLTEDDGSHYHELLIWCCF